MHDSQPRPLPGWLIFAASAGIVLHLAALAILVTAAPSGPWPSPFGGIDTMLAPQFAGTSYAYINKYFWATHLNHNYHFTTDRTEVPAIYFEVTLKDNAGKVIDTVKLPDKKTNPWLRHRQRMLAQSIGDDQPVMPPRGVQIDAPGQKTKMVTIWDNSEGENLKLKSIRPHEVPKDRPVSRPTEWSQLLAKSYMRYLCRKHGAASATLIRHSREPITPVVMFMDSIPLETWEEMKANFGEYRAEN